MTRFLLKNRFTAVDAVTFSLAGQAAAQHQFLLGVGIVFLIAPLIHILLEIMAPPTEQEKKS